MIESSCAGCGKKYKVEDRYAGKKAKCKVCGGTIQFPTGAAVGADAPEPLAVAAAPSAKPAARKVARAPVAPTGEVDLSALDAIERTGQIDTTYVPEVPAEDPNANRQKFEGTRAPDWLIKNGGKPGKGKPKQGLFKPVDKTGAKAAAAKFQAQPNTLSETLIPGPAGYVFAGIVVIGLGCFISPKAAGTMGVILGGLGIAFCIYAKFKAMYLARDEGLVPYLLYRFVPFYSFYFVATRWLSMYSAVFAWMKGFALIVLGMILIFRGGPDNPLLRAILHKGGDSALNDDDGFHPRKKGSHGGGGGGAFATGDNPLVKPAARPARTTFPDRDPNAKEAVGPSIFRYTVRLDDQQYAGEPMTLWLYIPPDDFTRDAKPGSLPCVLVPACWSNGVQGRELEDTMKAEHNTWAANGFVVVAFELSGGQGDPGVTFDRQAIQQFMGADGGLANARAALDYALTKVPEINKNRIYVAGFDTGANVAIDFAATDPRVKACVAFAPPSDLVAHFGEDLSMQEEEMKGITAFAKSVSPINHVGEINCPVYLFHADNDDAVKKEDNEKLAAALKAAGKTVDYVTVPSGGHHDSMVQAGIPGAVEWIKAFEKTGTAPTGPAASSAAPAPAQAPAAAGDTAQPPAAPAQGGADQSPAPQPQQQPAQSGGRRGR